LGGDNFFALVRKERLERFLAFAASLNLILSSNAKRTRLTIDSWIGVYPVCEGDSISEVLNNASFANGQAKRSHISVAWFDASAKEQSLRVKQIAQTLPEAMRVQELAAFYQPKVSSGTGDLTGGEALVRWMRDGKLIPPNEFISAAEASGLITSLDLYMLEAVCRDLRKWLDAGIEPVRISVNYSGRDFYKESLIKDTLDVMRKYCVDGSYLEIEITESSFFENMAALEAFISEMHKNGVKVSLDDFGTGYSSLNMLKSLDLDTVKLDKSFFVNLDSQSEKDRALLQNIAYMINELKKTAVSEGIENAEQIDFARKIGCEVVQGYYFDKPLSYEEFTERLLNRHYKISVGPGN
ncbi:MAG: EAL domain-containing protein, partial [Oscillospiraceae bacterium]|nr:EAL domain-containing protein [Oscillospiraceae bacterium]